MRRVLALLVIATLSYAQQSAPAFEVASVKANQSGPEASNGFSPSPGRLRVTNCTLKQLIQAAFHVKTGMLFGLTGWMESDRFDIDAKAAGKSNFDEDLAMLCALLADRFQLRFHRETRQLKIQALLVGKDGPKFHASPHQEEHERVTIRPGEISGTAIPFGHFISILEAQLEYPITNETRIVGQFDLSLKYVREGLPEAEGPSVFAALEDQLGLKLETRRGPVEVFVVDSAAKPRAD